MGIKESIQSILTRIRTVAVTTPDGVSTTMYAAVFNEQYRRKMEGQGYVYQVPATFVETIISNGIPIGQGVNGYDIIFRVHVEINDYNTEGTLDEAFYIFDIRDAVHRKLNNFKPTNCSHLQNAGITIDHDHDNTVVIILDYITHLVDITGSQHDMDSGDYMTVTIENPVLVLLETVYYGILPEGGGGAVEALTGSISSGYGVGPTVWRDGAGAPANTLGYNGDYYLNDTNGDVYRKIAGVYVIVANIKGADGGGGGGGGFTNVIYPEALTYQIQPSQCLYGDSDTVHGNVDVNVSLIIEGAECWIVNRSPYKMIFTGQNVFDSDNTVVLAVLPFQTMLLREVDGRVHILVGGNDNDILEQQIFN